MAEGLTTHPNERRHNRTIYGIGYLTFGVVAIRELTFRAGEESFLAAAGLLAATLLLMATDPFLFRRLPPYRYLYFPLQTALIQALGLLPPCDEDIWGMLYLFVAVQALYHLPRRAAVAWGCTTAVLTTATLGLTTGLTYGLGLGLTYVAGGVLLVSWELMSARAETARRASQTMLVDLRQANRQLEECAAQAEAEAATRERDRLAHELHDSVSQTLFGLTLAAESARLQLDRDPSAVPELLDRLQEMTGSALSQMRSLIAEWRPR